MNTIIRGLEQSGNAADVNKRSLNEQTLVQNPARLQASASVLNLTPEPCAHPARPRADAS